MHVILSQWAKGTRMGPKLVPAGDRVEWTEMTPDRKWNIYVDLTPLESYNHELKITTKTPKSEGRVFRVHIHDG